MRNIVAGVCAHVDAGKTTLSEAILYRTGSIRKLGRVDNQDAFLDNFAVERERGITVFSKQAVFTLGERRITLLDTPGHVDFSAEMERTLQVLDYAILVVSGSAGVQGHTKPLWSLLKQYKIPVFIFVNKMDMPDTDKGKLLENLRNHLSDACVDFSDAGSDIWAENVAVCDEDTLADFLETGRVEREKVVKLIAERNVFPCFFGSALKLEGIEEFLTGLDNYMRDKKYSPEFGARVFKITRDAQGNRLTHMKITGGQLQVRSLLKGEDWEEKVNQLRLYSGEKFEAVEAACAGDIVAATGLSFIQIGEGLGKEKGKTIALLEPVLSYRILFDGMDPMQMLPKLKAIEEEEPALQILWEEELREMHVRVMGEVQTEVLQRMIKERYGAEVTFGDGRIVYKETIANTVEGVGHFEPLRHYAEVHLLLEPGERGSGLVFASDVSEDNLERNWQRLILTHLEEKAHRGVLTGSVITDMKITLVGGRAHQKHTEGGDFRQATYRAVRQGLMQAQSVLLEPFYEYTLEVPETMIGKAMTDLERMGCSFGAPLMSGGNATLSGQGPVRTMKNYQKDVAAYTKGMGQLSCQLKGYEPCKDSESIIEERGYDPERDMRNPTGSVFCAHGAGFVVPWYEVPDYMHVESYFGKSREEVLEEAALQARKQGEETSRMNALDLAMGTEEINRILERASNANRRADRSNQWLRKKAGTAPQYTEIRSYKPSVKKDAYLLVDGYNIIFAWEELKTLAETTIDGARGRLQDILCNYQGMKRCEVIVVFDAYRVKGHDTEILDYHNIHVVYTKEAETADQYIEKFAHEHGSKYDVTVATSDGLEQIIIRGQGCKLLSAREFEAEVKAMEANLRQDYLEKQPAGRNLLGDVLPDDILGDPDLN